MNLLTRRPRFGTLLSLAVLGFGSFTASAQQKLPFHGKLEQVDTAAQTITIGKTARVFHVLPTTKIKDGSGNPTTLAAATAGEDVGGSYTKEADGTLNLFSVRFGAKMGTAASEPAPMPAAVPASTTTTTAPMASQAPKTPENPPVAPTAPITAAEPNAITQATAGGPAPDADSDKATAGKKQRFSGKVISVDTASNSLVVHGRADQTFTLTSTTKMTGAATLANITAGSKVSGSYTRTADGKLMVSTLKVK